MFKKYSPVPLIITILPTKYNGIPFGANTIIALSIYALVVLLPIILILDLFNKRFKIVIKTILIVVILFFLSWGLKKQILDIYLYSKPVTSNKIPAEPPMKKIGGN